MSFLGKIGVKRFFVYTIIFLLVLLVSFPFLITKAINTSYIKNKISTLVYQKTGTHIDASKFSLAFFPKASFNIDNFYFNSNTMLDVKINSLKFNFDIQKLLYGRIAISQVTIDHPVIQISSLKENKSSLPYSDLSVSKIITSTKKIFDFLPEHQKSVELVLQDVTSQYFRAMDGFVFLEKDKKKITVQSTIKKISFNSSQIPDIFFKKNSGLDSFEAEQLKCSFKLNPAGTVKGKFRLFGPKIRSLKNQMIFDAQIMESLFILSDNLFEIDIKPFEINYPKAKIGMHFKNSQTEKKSQLTFTGKNIHIDQAKKMSLLVFKDNEIASTLFEILKNGVVPEITLSFRSKHIKNLFKGSNLKLKGNIKNGVVEIPETKLTVSSVDASASINKGVLKIITSKGSIQKTELEKGTLSIDLINYIDFPFQGEFLLDVDLEKLPQTLISLMPDTLLAKELALVHDVTGHSKAKLNLSKETQSDALKIDVNADSFKASGRYDRVPGDIMVENVNFIYKKELVYLKNLTCMINNNILNDFNVMFDFADKGMITVQSGSAIISMDYMIPWLISYEKPAKFLLPVKDSNGRIRISSMELSGPLFNPDLWKYDVNGTVDKVNIAAHPDKKQMENLSCQYHISDDFLDFKQINTKINNLFWMEPFIEKKHFNSILMPLELDNGHFLINEKKSLLNADIKFANGPEVSINLKGETPLSLAFKTISFFDKNVSNGSISFQYSKTKPLYEFNGTFDTSTFNKIIKPESFWAKKINNLTKGEPFILEKDKNSYLNISTKTIDLNPYIFDPKKKSINYDLLPDKIIHLKADNLLIKDRIIKNIDTLVSVKKNHSYIRIKKARLCDMETQGFINFKENRVFAKFPIKAKNRANIQDLLTCLFQKNEFMDGRYSLTGNIHSDAFKKDFFNQLTGSLKFTADQGRIYKSTLLSRILSVLNISKIFKGKVPDITQKGFAYNDIVITADIKESIIYLNRAVINGDDMTLIFQGWIDPFNDKIDLTCLVAPFKTIDLIIEHIPIVNTILNGRLVSVPVKATGKFSDPVVIPMHPSAVGKGLINKMSDIMKAPIKLWDKFYEQ